MPEHYAILFFNIFDKITFVVNVYYFSQKQEI